MLTLSIDCEVLPDRLVTIKLPETVRLGRHELVIVLEEDNVGKNSEDTSAALMRFSGAVAAFRGVDGVEYQNRVRSEWG